MRLGVSVDFSRGELSCLNLILPALVDHTSAARLGLLGSVCPPRICNIHAV